VNTDFIVIGNGLRIRINRIITFFEKIGAAYDEYSAYSDACMGCTSRYSKKELEDMSASYIIQRPNESGVKK
jgi:uncharacterized protein (DUF983 family)